MTSGKRLTPEVFADKFTDITFVELPEHPINDYMLELVKIKSNPRPCKRSGCCTKVNGKWLAACQLCGKRKPLEEFYGHIHQGHMAGCKACYYERHIED